MSRLYVGSEIGKLKRVILHRPELSLQRLTPRNMRGELWDWMVDVNLHGVYNGVQAFVPRMYKS